MQGNGPALPLMTDVNFQAEDIAELPLQRIEVGVPGLRCISIARAADIIAGPGTIPLAPSSLFRLAHGQALCDDFPCQRLGILGSRDGACVAHTDIPSQKGLANKVRKIEQS